MIQLRVKRIQPAARRAEEYPLHLAFSGLADAAEEGALVSRVMAGLNLSVSPPLGEKDAKRLLLASFNQTTVPNWLRKKGRTPACPRESAEAIALLAACREEGLKLHQENGSANPELLAQFSANWHPSLSVTCALDESDERAVCDAMERCSPEEDSVLVCSAEQTHISTSLTRAPRPQRPMALTILHSPKSDRPM